MSDKARLYRHYSAGQLDNTFVKISMKLRNPAPTLSIVKREALERLLVLIDEEREHRLPHMKTKPGRPK